MNRLGMIVDLSHSSKRVMEEAIDTSLAPVIFSHSASAAMYETTLNVPDNILTKLVGHLNFYIYVNNCRFIIERKTRTYNGRFLFKYHFKH